MKKHPTNRREFLTSSLGTAAGSTRADVIASQVGNVHNPTEPGLEDFGDVVLSGNGGAGYIRVDWFTPAGLKTYGDSRLTIPGTELEGLLDQDLIDVASIDPSVPVSGTDYEKPLTQIRLQSQGVVGAHEREDLLVPLPPRRLECCFEKTPGDALAPEFKVDVSSERADVIKGCRVRGEGLHDLKPHQPLVRPANGYFPNAATVKVEEVIALCLDSEWRVKCGVHARLDDRIENPNECVRVGRFHVTN